MKKSTQTSLNPKQKRMLVECSVSQDQRKEGFSSISVVVYGMVWFDGLTLFFPIGKKQAHINERVA